jgi:chromosome partitioning protein
MFVYAVTSQKGGVGKTTTTVNLGAGLARSSQRVLLIDLDPQASLTASVGVSAFKSSLVDVLFNPEWIIGSIYPCAGGMHVIPSSASLANAFIEMSNMDAPAWRISQALRYITDKYDYVLIDCPPSLGHATTNALTAAHVALVPLQCEYLSLRGLADVQEISSAIQDSTNPDLRLRVVATMFDKRTVHANDVLREARSCLPGLVYESVIPRTIRLAEAPAVGKTILEYAPDSNGAYAYCALAKEIMEEDQGYGTTRRYTGGFTEPARTGEAA